MSMLCSPCIKNIFSKHKKLQLNKTYTDMDVGECFVCLHNETDINYQHVGRATGDFPSTVK